MAKTAKTAGSPATEEAQTRMTFGEHLDELRKRIIRALYGGLIGVGICVYFTKEIYNFVVEPYKLVALAHHMPDVMQTLKPQEAFFTPLTLAVKAGLVLTSPWIIYQLWQFVGAGLYKKERKAVYRYIVPSTLLFLLGVAFFYFIVLPLTLQFFFTFSGSGGTPANPNSFQHFIMQFTSEMPIPAPPATTPAPSTTSTTATGTSSATAPAPFPAGPLMIPSLDHDPPAPPEGQALLFYNSVEQRVKILLHDQTQIPMVVAQGALFINEWRADDYIAFVTFTALIFGVAFELPMIMLVLSQIDIVPAKSYRSARKYAYFGIGVGAVIIAPSGDIMTLAFLFIPLIVLYEVGIIAAAFVTRNRPKDD